MKFQTAFYMAQRFPTLGSTRTGRTSSRKPNKSNEPRHVSDSYSFANGFPWGKPDE